MTKLLVYIFCSSFVAIVTILGFCFYFAVYKVKMIAHRNYRQDQELNWIKDVLRTGDTAELLAFAKEQGIVSEQYQLLPPHEQIIGAVCIHTQGMIYGYMLAERKSEAEVVAVCKEIAKWKNYNHDLFVRGLTVYLGAKESIWQTFSSNRTEFRYEHHLLECSK